MKVASLTKFHSFRMKTDENALREWATRDVPRVVAAVCGRKIRRIELNPKNVL